MFNKFGPLKESKGLYSILLLTGLLLIFCRAAFTVIYPTMYAEDGVWLANRFLHDWFGYAIYSRHDYLIFGNVLLVQIAFYITKFIWGCNLLYYPVVVAVLSFVWFDLLAFAAVVYLRKLLSLSSRIFLFYSILLLPMGVSLGEIYGRLCNIGYGCFYLAFVVTIWFFFTKGNIWSKTFSYVLLLFCCMTNPVAYFLLGAVLVFEGYRGYKNGERKRLRFATFWSGVTGLSLVYLYFACKRTAAEYMRLFGPDILKSLAEYNSKFYIKWEAVTEYFGHCWLYSVIWPFYERMNDYIIWGLLIGLVIVCLVGYMKSNQTYRRLLFMTYTGTVFFSVIALVARKNLTWFASNYTSTFPDRYYYTQNVLMLFLVAVLLSACQQWLGKAIWLRRFVFALGIWIITLPFLYAGSTFEWVTPRFPEIDSQVCFGEQVWVAHENQGKREEYEVGIFPRQFTIKVPYEYVAATARAYESRFRNR